MNVVELRAEYAALLPQLRDFRSVLLTELERVSRGHDVEIRSRIKSWDATREKMRRVSFPRVADLSDLLGVTLVAPDAETVSLLGDALRNEFAVVAEWRQAPQQGDGTVHYVVRSASSLTEVVAAEIQVVTANEEARRELAHADSYNSARAAEPARATLRLEEVINQFVALLERPHVHEKRDVHAFVERHPFLLYPNRDALVSEVPIGFGTEHRMDFLVQRADGTYLLVEIENPLAPLVTQKNDFTAEVNHALCQVEDWQDWLEAHVQTVEERYPGLRAPEAWVVIGREHQLDIRGKRRFLRRNINMRGRVTLKTYDDLIAEARAYVRNIRGALGDPAA